MSGFLNEMARSSLERVELARQQEPESELWKRASEAQLAPSLTLHPDRLNIIAELKLRSPAVGALRATDENVGARVSAYAKGGACAVSVLTEPTRFDGSLDHLRQASAALASYGVPAMRKDFIVDHYQVMEARAAGAGGVLVILRMLDHGRIVDLLDCAAMLKMFVLLEAFDEQDLEIATKLVEERVERVEQLLVGVNCRDLDTLQVVPERLLQLADKLPTKVPRVAESGVATAEDAAKMVQAGYQVALIGSALMKQDDPAQLIAAMAETGIKAT